MCKSSTSSSATQPPAWCNNSAGTRRWPNWPKQREQAKKRSSRRSKPDRVTAPRSIDANESEDDPLSARLGEHDGNYDSVEDRVLLGPALATLPEREQSILRMRFVDGLTQSEIGSRWA